MLSERDEQVLLALKFMDYLTIRQIARLFDLQIDNTYKLMKKLRPFVNVFKHEGYNVYYLNKSGQELIGCEKIRRPLTTVSHYLMRTDLYIYLNKPATWQNEVKLTYTYKIHQRTGSGILTKPQKIMIIPDAYFLTDRHHVIEIDYMQKMNKNRQKVERYRRLIEKGVFRTDTTTMPEIIWVTTTEHRKQALDALCEGLDVKVYLGSDLQ